MNKDTAARELARIRGRILDDMEEDMTRLKAQRDSLLAALESCKEWMDQLHAVRGKWEAPGMEARYREICAAVAQAKGE